MISAASVIKQYQGAVSRYTSYPTAPQFKAGMGPALMNEMFDSLEGHEPVSVYIHIPFCDRLCWFCGCNTKHTQRYQPISNYVDHLIDEIALLRQRMGTRQPISQLHLGGGSPSLLVKDDMARLRAELETVFEFGAETEVSVEIDPSDSNAEMFEGLKAIGITRASIGVQDFHQEVQEAINR
ncbi:MAG: radical SAM protein, partial [Pseudomonadota bacterium]